MCGGTNLHHVLVTVGMHSCPCQHRHPGFRVAGMGTSRCTRMDVPVPKAAATSTHTSMRATTWCKRVGTYSFQFFGVRRPLPILLPQPGTEPAYAADPVPQRAALPKDVSYTDCPLISSALPLPPPAEVPDPGSSSSIHGQRS